MVNPPRTDKMQFLETHKSLVEYIVQAWSSFDHFEIKNRSKRKNRASDTPDSTYSSLHQAFIDYQWNGKSFAQGTKELLDFRIGIDKYIRERESAELFASLCTVLHWGGVLTNSITGPVLQKHLDNELIDYMEWIVERKPFDATVEQLNIFENPPSLLLSDSGTTKIYAVVNDQCIIYDDRVAASFCYLISKYLKSQSLPNSLQLVVGARDSKRRNRDPSTAEHRFIKKSPRICKTEHANSNLKANWVISAVARQLRQDNSEFRDTVGAYTRELNCDNEQWIAMRIIEASLFMAGHAVPYTALK